MALMAEEQVPASGEGVRAAPQHDRRRHVRGRQSRRATQVSPPPLTKPLVPSGDPTLSASPNPEHPKVQQHVDLGTKFPTQDPVGDICVAAGEEDTPLSPELADASHHAKLSWGRTRSCKSQKNDKTTVHLPLPKTRPSPWTWYPSLGAAHGAP